MDQVGKGWHKIAQESVDLDDVTSNGQNSQMTSLLSPNTQRIDLISEFQDNLQSPRFNQDQKLGPAQLYSINACQSPSNQITESLDFYQDDEKALDEAPLSQRNAGSSKIVLVDDLADEFILENE